MSRSFLTSSPSHKSPRVRERSPRNMTSSKTWLLSGLFMSAFLECLSIVTSNLHSILTNFDFMVNCLNTQNRDKNLSAS